MATRPRGRRAMLLAFGACLLALLSPSGSPADGTTIEPGERASGFYWNPSTATIAPGESIGFRNPGKVVPHGLAWTGGPEKPSCSGIPVDSSGTDWSGSCSFAQAGTYSFVCTVHPEMQGSISVGAGAAPPGSGPSPPPGGTPEPPGGGESSSLHLPRSQRGNSIRGSFVLDATGAGGRLTVELRARAAAMGLAGDGTVRVGRLVRAPLGAGRQRFAVALKPAARQALRERRRLPLAVQIVVSPPDGATLTLNRKVVAHAA